MNGIQLRISVGYGATMRRKSTAVAMDTGINRMKILSIHWTMSGALGAVKSYAQISLQTLAE